MIEPNVSSPFVGARPFNGTKEDQVRFFGRSNEIRKLVSLVIAHPALLVYASSGAGKTSVLNAGVIPALEARHFRVLPVARFSAPTNQNLPVNVGHIPNPYIYNLLSWWMENPPLDGTLETHLMNNVQDTKVDWSAVENANTSQPRIVILDQFEELFNVYPESWEKRADVFRQLNDALTADRLLRIIIAMREDRIADLDPYLSFLHDRIDTRYHLQPLGHDAAIMALTKPLELFGYYFADGLDEQLVEQLLQNHIVTGIIQGEFVEPVQLQLVGERVWKKRQLNTKVITQTEVPASGDVDAALREFYETVLNEAVRETRFSAKELRNWVEHSLITPLKTRSIVYAGIPTKIISVLENRHLLRREERGGVPFYELTHDRLIIPILQSNQEWRQLRTRRQRLGIGLTISIFVIISLAVFYYKIYYLKVDNPSNSLRGFDIGIAFAQFSYGPLANETKYVDNYIVRANREFNAQISLISNQLRISIGTLSPEQVGSITGQTSAQRIQSVTEIARQTSADIVVYGVIDHDVSGMFRLLPSFYISSSNAQQTQDLLTSSRLESPILINDSMLTYNSLSQRLIIMTLTELGLKSYVAQEYDRASQMFQRARELSQEENNLGLDVIDVMRGDALFQEAQQSFRDCHKEVGLGLLQDAENMYTESKFASQDYTRAYIGLAYISYLRAGGLPNEYYCSGGNYDRVQVDQALKVLDQAESSLEIISLDNSTLLDLHLLKVRIKLLQYAQDNSDTSADKQALFDDLRQETQLIIVNMKSEGSVSSEAYGLLGATYLIHQDYDQAILSFKEALSSTSLSPQLQMTFLGNIGTAYAYLKRYDEAVVSYEQALKIAQRIGSDQTIYENAIEHLRNPSGTSSSR